MTKNEFQQRIKEIDFADIAINLCKKVTKHSKSCYCYLGISDGKVVYSFEVLGSDYVLLDTRLEGAKCSDVVEYTKMLKKDNAFNFSMQRHVFEHNKNIFSH